MRLLDILQAIDTHGGSGLRDGVHDPAGLRTLQAAEHKALVAWVVGQFENHE